MCGSMLGKKAESSRVTLVEFLASGSRHYRCPAASVEIFLLEKLLSVIAAQPQILPLWLPWKIGELITSLNNSAHSFFFLMN